MSTPYDDGARSPRPASTRRRSARQVWQALDEDLPGDDVDRHRRRSPPTRTGTAVFAAREAGVVAGLGVAALVFHEVMGDDVDASPTGCPTAPGSRPATS